MRRIILLVIAIPLFSACGRAGPDAGWASQALQDSVEARLVTTPLQGGPWLGPSPDGRQLVGYIPLERPGQLGVASADGQIRRLTGPPGNAPGDAPRFSRDGRWIAYNWYPEGTDWQSLEIRVIPAAGGEPRVIHTSGYAVPMDWSPDGRQVAVADFRDDGTVQVLLVPVDGGEPQLVRSLGWRMPAAVNFSSDGRFLAYDAPTGTESAERDLVVYELATRRERRVLNDPANDLLLGWSPTGSLLFMSERSGTPAAWRVEMENGAPRGEPRIVKPDFFRTNPVGFTRAGDFYYAVGTGGPFAVALALDSSGRPSGPPRPVTSAGEVGLPNRFASSRDGRLLSFVPSFSTGVRRDNGRGGVLFTVRPVDGGESRDFHLPPSIRDAGEHRWLPDGTALIFKGNQEGRYGLFRLDLRSGGVERVHSGGGLDGLAGLFRFDITPDGRSIVYGEQIPSRPTPRERLVVRELATGQERVLSSAEASGPGIRSVAVSPDGKLVAHYRLGRDAAESRAGVVAAGGDAELMVVPLAGGEPRLVARTGGGEITWTPDGSHLLVGGSEIVRIALDGGEPEKLGVGGRVVSAGPDGRRLIVIDPNNMQGRYDLWLLRLSATP